jgi:hypothetical protein
MYSFEVIPGFADEGADPSEAILVLLNRLRAELQFDADVIKKLRRNLADARGRM